MFFVARLILCREDETMRVAKDVTLSDDERAILSRWARGRSTPARRVLRAKIVLRAADGERNDVIAAELGCTRRTVGVWRNRFLQLRIAGIEKDAPRSGRRSSIPRKIVKEILDKTTTQKPQAATHWSVRTMAEEVGVGRSTVQRIWQAHGLKPHLTKTFKVSNDPQFAEKVIDIVGLYLTPPEHALVLSCDEKSQIQALDRTQKSLPIYPGRLGTMTHDYKRNGTTTLFAALNVADGIVIADCMKRHRNQEWIKFLKRIDESTPPELDLHLIVDNYATHKHENVKRWLARHPRFHIHFTPTSSSWLNLVERWFRDLTDKRLKRGVFRSVEGLIEAIEEYIEHHNDLGKAFTWVAQAQPIIDKVKRARAALNKIPSE
jgi:transposase